MKKYNIVKIITDYTTDRYQTIRVLEDQIYFSIADRRAARGL